MLRSSLVPITCINQSAIRNVQSGIYEQFLNILNSITCTGFKKLRLLCGLSITKEMYSYIIKLNDGRLNFTVYFLVYD